MRHRRETALALALLLLLALAAPADAVAAKHPGSTLEVFTAASLAEAFRELASEFERTHPMVSVRLNVAGSQQLASQLEHGARADVFASADERWMEFARDDSLLASAPVVFARNRITLIVPRANPARIARVYDLARHGIKLVIGAPAVPVGMYGRAVLKNLSRLDGYGADFAERVLANVVSEEENVKSVAGKVQLGEADAGMVYRSDVTPSLARAVREVEIPEAANVTASYPIAVARSARQPEAASEFVALVLSPPGQQVLERHGFLTAPSNAP